MVRTHWQPLQDEFFASAHELARQAKAYMDDGREQEATEELTRYMAENAERMVATVNTLHAELSGMAVVV